MQKAIIFTAYNGAEIRDVRPEAEMAYEKMRSLQWEFALTMKQNQGGNLYERI